MEALDPNALEVDLVLEKIFRYVGVQDLKNCRLVSRLWNSNASRLFWKETEIPVSLIHLEKGSTAGFECSRFRGKVISDSAKARARDIGDFLDLLESRSTKISLSLQIFSLEFSKIEKFCRLEHVRNSLAAIHIDIPTNWLVPLKAVICELPKLKKLSLNVLDVQTEEKLLTKEDKMHATSNIESFKLKIAWMEGLLPVFEILVASCFNLKEFIYDGPVGTNMRAIRHLLQYYRGPGLREFQCTQGGLYQPNDNILFGQFLESELLRNAVVLDLGKLVPLNKKIWEKVFSQNPWHKLKTFKIAIAEDNCVHCGSPDQQNLRPPHYHFLNLIEKRLPQFTALKNMSITAMGIPHEHWQYEYGAWNLVDLTLNVEHGEQVPDLKSILPASLKTLSIKIPELAVGLLGQLFQNLPKDLEKLSIETCCDNGSWIQDYDIVANNRITRLKNLKVLNIGLDCSNLTNDAIRYGFVQLPKLEELRLMGMPLKFSFAEEEKLRKKLKKFDIITCGLHGSKLQW